MTAGVKRVVPFITDSVLECGGKNEIEDMGTTARTERSQRIQEGR